MEHNDEFSQKPGQQAPQRTTLHHLPLLPLPVSALTEAGYNEFGEWVGEEAEAPQPLAPFISQMYASMSPAERDALNAEMVMNYYRSKNPNKLTEFERHILFGTPWTPPLNKRQRDRHATR